MDFLKKNLKKEFPLYLTLAALIVWSVILVGCGAIPTSYTTNTSEKNLVRQNSMLQIEFLRRCDKMAPEKRLEFLRQNVLFAIAIEEIITGETSSAKEIFQSVLEAEKEEADAKKKTEGPENKE